MVNAFVRSVLPGDLAYIGAHMRLADRQELEAAQGPVDPQEALYRAVLLSTSSWVLVGRSGRPFAAFGVAPLSLLDGSGLPWLLGTDEAAREGRTLVREGRKYVPRMLEEHPHLVNYVDARNGRSVEWLRRLGFTVHAPAPYGVAGLPFHRFEMRA